MHFDGSRANNSCINPCSSLTPLTLLPLPSTPESQVDSDLAYADPCSPDPWSGSGLQGVLGGPKQFDTPALKGSKEFTFLTNSFCQLWESFPNPRPTSIYLSMTFTYTF